MFYIQKDNSGILAWKLQINSVIGSFFYKDQLLLQKENDTYTIPYGENPPVPVSHTLEVDYRDGLPARTAELDTPVEGNDRYVHMGLRASWGLYLESVLREGG